MVDENQPGPLVPAKYAGALAAAGVALCAAAQLLPPDFRELAVVVSYLLCAAGGHEWKQPQWFRERPMVSPPVALAFGGMAAGAYDWAAASGTPLAHLLGLTLSAAAGVVTQPTMGLRNGAMGRETLRTTVGIQTGEAERPGKVLLLVPLLLLAGLAQGCATGTHQRRANVGDMVGSWVAPKPPGVAKDAPLALPVAVGPCVGASGDSKAGAPLEATCSTLAVASAWDRTVALALLGDWQSGPVGGLGACGELTDGKRPYEVLLCAGAKYPWGWWSALTVQAKFGP